MFHDIYPIDGKKNSVSIPSRKKYGLDKWLISPPRTSKTSHHVNPLHLSVSNLTQT